ncbi:MAG: hypothetical protein KC996_10915 [Phycisphaerales bacterium]|nr:hypothetical protein [Phycisphaerales bacterium]
MNMQKTLLLRVLIIGAAIYAAWIFGLRPKIHEQTRLKETRLSQMQLISESGFDFDARRDETDKAHTLVSTVGGNMLETLRGAEDQKSARELVTNTARSFGVEVNRVEPLRVTDFGSGNKKKRFDDNGKADGTKSIRFKGEGVRVEFEGSFAGIAGLLQQLDQDNKTLKLENFRMVSSSSGEVRMIAQFMKFELVEAPDFLTSDPIASADAASSGE